MATSAASFTWQHGFRQPSEPSPSSAETERQEKQEGGSLHYVTPPSQTHATSTVSNSLGSNVMRTWPTLFDGTESPLGLPSWWQPSGEVDVLICGAGPTGLEIALSLVRQRVTFRILDKGKTPLIAGRADSVLPRYLETLASWGLAPEVHEEGPIIERTAVYKDGKMLFHGRSHQSDSRYRGLHVITQGQLEKIFIRDLMRHRVLVERNTILLDYEVSKDVPKSHPIKATIQNGRTGEEEVIRAKFLVGSDGAASPIRHKLGIPFDGVSTDIYWGIMDCKFESDYPHAWIFGGVLSTEHGACVIIPREDGYNRLYTQLDVSSTGSIRDSRQAKDSSFQEAGGNVDVHSITPEEVLEQANRIFSPYKITFGAPLSWFAVWKVSERVARSFSSEDLRIHLAGDAAHVHSVFGAFGLNASILDAANLGWKIGLCVRNKADMDQLLPTYDRERRLHAADIIDISGTYLRYSCNRFDVPVPKLHYNGADLGNEAIERSIRGKVSGIGKPGMQLPDHLFLADFYMRYGAFLLGLDFAYGASILNPKQHVDATRPPITVENGVRCPNPRVCFNEHSSGYLYDKMMGPAFFHVLIFASDLLGPVREKLKRFSTAVSTGGFYCKFGGREVFNLVVIAKCLPFEIGERMADPEFSALRDAAAVIFDDRAPDEDAHTTFGVDHANGAVVVVRPDLWVGLSISPTEVQRLDQYFGSFLLPQKEPNRTEGKPNDLPPEEAKKNPLLCGPTNGYITHEIPNGLLVDGVKGAFSVDEARNGHTIDEAKDEVPVDEPGALESNGEYFVAK